MIRTKIFSILIMTCLMLSTGSVSALDLLPIGGGAGEAESKPETPAPPPPPNNGLVNSYWLMSEGAAVGYKVKVAVNGQSAASMKKPGEALEVTKYLRLGLNTVKFTAVDEQRRPSSPSASELNIILGPEYKRTNINNFGSMSVELREMTVCYVRPFAYRTQESDVEIRFTLADNPNPAHLAKKYVLYADGKFTGHMIQVGVNGIPIIDVMSPNFHCDLNPFLKKGENEITFVSAQMPGYPFTATDRAAFKEDEGLAVGVATAGDFDPVTYDEPIRQILPTSQRVLQTGQTDQGDVKESFIFIAE